MNTKNEAVREVNGYWVDDNNNRWNCRICSKETAERLSGTLIDCYDCTNCRHCNYCYNCHHCYNCNYCRDYKTNPQRYITPQIGSRNAQTEFYWLNKDDVRVICGCFKGNLQAFKDAVLKAYKDNPAYKEQYFEEIKKLEMLLK